MTDYQINFIPKTEAYFILIKAPHLKYYSSYELSSHNRQHKYDDFEDYSITEKGILSACIAKINSYEFFPLQNINFIKIKAGKDWDYPYTFIVHGINVIALTTKALNNFISLGINNRHLQETILHEIIHLHQKRNQDDYSLYYKSKYHFKQKYIENYELQKESMITNPDGYYTNPMLWTIEIKGDHWFPYLDIRHEEKLRKINIVAGKYYLMQEFAPQEVLRIYQDMFQVQSQRYHPNEIFARSNAKKLIYGR